MPHCLIFICHPELAAPLVAECNEAYKGGCSQSISGSPKINLSFFVTQSLNHLNLTPTPISKFAQLTKKFDLPLGEVVAIRHPATVSTRYTIIVTLRDLFVKGTKYLQKIRQCGIFLIALFLLTNLSSLLIPCLGFAPHSRRLAYCAYAQAGSFRSLSGLARSAHSVRPQIRQCLSNLAPPINKTKYP